MKVIKIAGLAAAALLAAGPARAAEQAPAGGGPRADGWWQGAYLQAGAEAWSNGLPVLALDGDWSAGYEPRAGRQRAYQAVHAEAGVILAPEVAGRRWPWRVAALVRAEAFASLSGEAAELVYHYQSRTDPADARRYDASHRTLSWQGRGVAVHAPELQLGSLKMTTSVQWLRLSRLRRTGSQGEAGYDGAGGYAYDLAVQDDSDRTRAPFMPGPAARGDGASISVGWQWAPSTAWSLSLHLDDVWSRLRWQGINSDLMTLDSDVVGRTPEGYVDIQPALRGQYVRRTLSVEIPRTVRGSAVWHWPEGDWSVRLQRRWGLQQAWLGWTSPGPVRWEVAVEPRAEALRLGVSWRGLQAFVMADRADQAAHVRGGQLAWQAPF